MQAVGVFPFNIASVPGENTGTAAPHNDKSLKHQQIACEALQKACTA